jgi:hypothetical protein
MPVLEILQLKTKPDISPSNPSILKSLQTVRQSLAEKIHPTHSRFYRALEDPSLIYVLGLWPSIATHRSFLSSPLKASILSPQDDLLDFNWMIHIELDSIESMEELSVLDAPVVAIARLHVKGGKHVIAHIEITGRYSGMLVERTKPWVVVEGWRVDGEVGKEEQVVITGWQEKEDHMAFGAGLREKYTDYAGLRHHWEGFEANHMKDMEK